MNTVRFVKSFSKGQITIPKEFRDVFGFVNDFWLKLYIHDGKIIAEPVEQKINQEEYRKKLLSIKGVWDLTDNMKKNREEIEKRLTKNPL